MLTEFRLDLLRRRLAKLAKAKEDRRLSPLRQQAATEAHKAVEKELKANAH